MAIAVDTTGNGKNDGSASPLAFSYTASGSNIAMMVGIFGATTNSISSVTFNGNALTQLAAIAQGGSGRFIYLYGGIVAAATANISITQDVSDIIVADVATYTGVTAITAGQSKQTGASTTYFITDSTANDNSWHVMCARGGGTVSAGANTIVRSTTAADPDFAIFDSNGAITPAGSHTLNASSASGTWGGGSAILSPIPGIAGGLGIAGLTLLGVGS